MSAFESQVTVRRTRYSSPETGWAVVEAVADGADTVVLVGPLIHLEERERALVVGEWVNDSRYGRQVKVAQAHPLPPSDADADAVIAYLVRVKHVGTKRAIRLVDRYGPAGAFDAIDRDPHETLAAAGIRGAALAEATRSWERLRVTRRLHMLLAPHGLAYLASRIRETYGDGAHRLVSERPYELTSVFGVGFLTADRIARSLGAAETGPERTRAAILHTLSEAERGGSTCMPLELLLPTVDELLGPATLTEADIDQLVDDRDLAREENWIYRAQTAELEAELAERVQDLLGSPRTDRLGKPGAPPHRATASPRSR